MFHHVISRIPEPQNVSLGVIYSLKSVPFLYMTTWKDFTLFSLVPPTLLEA